MDKINTEKEKKDMGEREKLNMQDEKKIVDGQIEVEPQGGGELKFGDIQETALITLEPSSLMRCRCIRVGL